jgi:hypothetical protein
MLQKKLSSHCLDSSFYDISHMPKIVQGRLLNFNHEVFIIK